MRILQVSPFFYPAFNFGGPVGVIYDISKGLVNRGHDVVVYTTDAKDKHSRIKNNFINIDGISTQYFRNITMMSVKKLKCFITPGLISSVKKEIGSFDIVHLHEYRTFQNLIVAYYAKKQGIPYVLHAHGEIPRLINCQKLKCIFDALFGYKLLQDASKLFAISEFEVEHYLRMGVPREKIEIMPNGIDLSKYNCSSTRGSFKKKFGIGPEEKIVLYLGRINKIKGLDILLKAIANVVKKLNNVRFVIVGPDDGYLNELKALIGTLNLKKSVLFTGPLYGNEKIAAYTDADVYVLPSRYEIWGMTVLEAVACGTPSIVTETCGASRLLRNNPEFIVKPSYEELEVALLKILKDERIGNDFKIQSKSIIKKYDIDNIISTLEKNYSDLIWNKL